MGSSLVIRTLFTYPYAVFPVLTLTLQCRFLPIDDRPFVLVPYLSGTLDDPLHF